MQSSPAPDSSRVSAILSELAGRLEAEFRGAIESVRRSSAEQFHRAARRLDRACSQEEWAAAVLEAAAVFAPRAALFAAGRTLKGLKDVKVEAPLEMAPAFATALATGEPVAALRTPGELSEAVAAALGPALAGRCHLFPIRSRGRAAAVLYAEGENVDASALEVVAVLASAALQRGFAQPPEWDELSSTEQNVHLRARRFARVRVAEIRLYKARAVSSGRARGNLYQELKPDIDSARAAFQRQFLPAASSMPDYLHQELIRTLAHDDPALLGEEYPGPLV